MTPRKVLQDGLSREVWKLGETVELKLNQPQPETLELPFHQLLPSSHIDLLKFRIYVRTRCLHDLEFREAIMQMCEQDIIFFVNVFGWVFEPRPPRPIPLKLWPDQADLLAILCKYFGVRSIGVGKSRGIGDSWCVAFLYAWALRFRPEAKMAVFSKDKDSVDSDDENSNLGKIAYIIERLPFWMTHFPDGRTCIKRRREQSTIQSLDNGAVVQGFPATDNKSRGMRFTSTWNDESAFWPGDAQAAANTAIHTCPNRMHVSTFCGSTNAFYYMMYREKSSLLRIFHWWWANPARWQGAYTTEHGRVKILDTEYKFPPNYPFVADGLLRSAYVDNVLRESGSTVQSALEELYGVSGEASRRLFRPDTVQVVNTTVRPPERTGYIRPLPNREFEFRPETDGKVLIWGSATGTPRGGPYSAACDLAAGRGQAYSALNVIDLATGEQVLEYSDNRVDIVSFAQEVHRIALWLCGGKGHGHVYLTFENNGELGNAFGAELLRLGYGNIMRRRYRFAPPEGASHYYGLRNKDGGLRNFLELERAVRDGEVIVRSDAVVSEMELYDKEEKKDGKITPLFPYRQDGHGDRIMALAMAWFQARDRRVNEQPGEQKTLLVNRGEVTDPRVLYSELFDATPTARTSHSAGWTLR